MASESLDAIQREIIAACSPPLVASTFTRSVSGTGPVSGTGRRPLSEALEQVVASARSVPGSSYDAEESAESAGRARASHACGHGQRRRVRAS